jgi:2-polyprenyl-6-methoxyphenol hydroxylase-like FAD-dependent oxidoreductase
VGGGPAGLYFSLLAKLHDPQHHVTVIDRGRVGTTHGWGVTLGQDVLDSLRDNDAASACALEQAGLRWTHQTVHIGGEREVRGGYNIYNIARKTLVDVLASRAREVGVHISFGHEVISAGELPQSDLIVAADGARSRLRAVAGEFGTRVRLGENKYIWLGSSAAFDTFNYIFAPTSHGWIWAYAYQFDERTSTVIVECSARTWSGLGLDVMPVVDGAALLGDLFKDQLSGHGLITRLPDGSTADWLSFPTVSNQRWHSGNIVLAGDSAHTAHYSLGQGTKMALEDATVLADSLKRNDNLKSALTAYEAQRKDELVRPLSEARCSAEWFERLPRYIDLKPHQFATLLESRWSPLVQVLPPWASYQLRRATQRVPALDRIRGPIGSAVKIGYGRRNSMSQDDSKVRQSA